MNGLAHFYLNGNKFEFGITAIGETLHNMAEWSGEISEMGQVAAYEGDKKDNVVQRSFWKNPLFWGWAITVALIGIYVLLGMQSDCIDGVSTTKFEQLLTSRPNEIGDTLAGLAGALAFLWIIITVMLQKEELQEQRKELRLTREESEKMAEALDAQVTILRDEQKQRRVAQLNAENAQLISHARSYLLEYVNHNWSTIGVVRIVDFIPSEYRGSGSRIANASEVVFISAFAKLLDTIRQDKYEIKRPPRFDELLLWIMEIEKSFDELSTSDSEDLKQKGISHLSGSIRLLNLWND